jgi:uncharacterized membrane protein
MPPPAGPDPQRGTAVPPRPAVPVRVPLAGAEPAPSAAGPAAAPPAAGRHRYGPARHLPVALLVTAFAVYFAIASIRSYEGYGQPAFDLGIFDQGLWLLSRFHAPFVTVMGRNLFGDHTSFILLPLVPLYWIDPDVRLLLAVQACAVAAAAIPVYLLALRRLGSSLLATLFAAALLCSPALQNGLLEQFHPEALLVLTLSLALYAAIESKGRLLAVAAMLSLLAKEDVAVYILPLGLWVLLRRDRRWGAALMAGAAAWTAFAYGVVIREILGTAGFYADRLPFGGITGTLVEPFRRPGAFVRYLAGGGRPFYLMQLGTSVGWVFAVGPEMAAIALPAALENVISNDPYMHQVIYHYSMPIAPVLVFGTIWAVSRLGAAWMRRVATVLVLASAVASSALWGLAPWSRQVPTPAWSPTSPFARGADALEARIPPHAAVSAWYPFVAHLDHRTQIYLWPTPFSAEYWGLFTQDGQRLPAAGSITYVLLPAQLSSAQDRRVLRSILPQFAPVARRGGVVLYERVTGRPGLHGP